MNDNHIFVVADWAMKYLPRKYRESQTNWFAKRGISWHICVVFFKSSGQLQNMTYVHIFDNAVPQDSQITSSVIIDTVRDVMKCYEKVQSVHLWSDNAGCYKSTLTLANLYQNLGTCLKSYDFCEAQDGKGPCDRKAACIKGYIRRFVNEGNDVTTAKQMKEVIFIHSQTNCDIIMMVMRQMQTPYKRLCSYQKLPQKN